MCVVKALKLRNRTLAIREAFRCFHSRSIRFSSRTVVRQPEDLQMLFDIFQVSGQGLGMVRRALIHHHHDASAGTPGSMHQLLQEDLYAPCGLTRLHVVEEQSSPVAECSEDGLLAIDAGGADPLLPASEHPRAGQVGMQVKLRFILIPQFVVGVRV